MLIYDSVAKTVDDEDDSAIEAASVDDDDSVLEVAYRLMMTMIVL